MIVLSSTHLIINGAFASVAQFTATPQAARFEVFTLGVFGPLNVASQTGANAFVVVNAVPVKVHVFELVIVTSAAAKSKL